MKLILFLAARNAARNAVRTGLTAAMVVLGTGLLAMVLAWIAGVFGSITSDGADSLGHVRIVDPDFAAREPLLPIYEHIAEPGPLVAALAEVEGVTGAWGRIATGVTLTVGEEIGDVFGMAVGADPALYREGLHLHEKLIDGGWFTGADGEVVLGRKLAERTGARIGDEVLLLGMTQDGAPGAIEARLVGVVGAGNPLVDQQAFLTLADIQYLTDVSGAVEVLVFTEDPATAKETAAAIRVLPAARGYTVQAWSERDPFTSIVPVVQLVRGVIVTVVVFITSLGVWNTMMMSVLERTDEIGVMRAMGLSRAGTVALFVIEAAVIATIGGLLGAGLGGIGGYWLETTGLTMGEQLTQNFQGVAVPQTLYGDMSWQVAVACFGIGLAMAILGSALPAIRAAAIQPVTAMRSGR